MAVHAAATNDPLARIRDEGLNHSKVMEIVAQLTDVNGPRLTGSPEHKRAAEWARDEMARWGFKEAKLEPWGPFGRGWTLKRFSAQMTEPYVAPLIACPNAWSPGLSKPLTAEVVYFDIGSTNNFEQYRGKLAGKIVLASSIRDLKPRFEPLATRLNETNLLRLASANPSATSRLSRNLPAAQTNAASVQPRRSGAVTNAATSSTNAPKPSVARNTPASEPSRRARALAFLQQESVGLVVFSSALGDGGALFVAAASVPGAAGLSFTNSPRPWQTNAPAIPPQITLAAEDYNRLARLAQRSIPVKLAVDLKVEFQDHDPMSYNTLAEIPGTDLKDEIVMLGGHLDSWHAGTGATDNAIGAAIAMEAARLINALNLKPRRTIRVALWSGEEQGLLGSKAYAARHFGYYTNLVEPAATPRAATRSPRDATAARTRSTARKTTTERKLVTTREYDRFSAYFNVDNGAGKLRGIYLQGNEALRPLFRKWLEPLRDLEAETISASNTGGTDHLSFDAIGLPGFQFIQDPLEYGSRTHHSNQDTLDRLVAEDARQASVILAAMVYQAAMADEKLTRKPKE